METVDTHAHIYHPDETAYPMKPNPLRPPEATGAVARLQREMRLAGVKRTVLVQTGSAYGWDNRLLADTALENRQWAVGVCTLDPASPDSPGELERLASGFNVRGLRLESTRTSSSVFYHPGAVLLGKAARQLNVVICAHIRAQFLGQLAEFLGHFPEVSVVLDHAAYPKAAEGDASETVEGVVALARFRNLHVKLTFAVTGSEEGYPFQDSHPIVRRMIEAFGPDRCMWGSDFPCELWLKKATYRQHLALFTEELGLSAGERQAILAETPMRVWFT